MAAVFRSIPSASQTETQRRSLKCFDSSRFRQIFFLPLRRTTDSCSKPICCSIAQSAIGLKKKRGNRSPRKLTMVSEGKDDDESLPVCPGCGIIMQDSDPDLPGYFQKPKRPREEEEMIDIDDFDDESSDDEEEPTGVEGFFEESAEEEEVSIKFEGFSAESSDEGEKSVEIVDFTEESEEEEENSIKFEGFSEESSDEDEKLIEIKDFLDELEDEDEELDDGFGPAGVGYGNITEERKKREKLSKSEKKRRAREEGFRNDFPAVVCARCHSLRNYGLVKNARSENLIPDFDFDRLISGRLMKPTSCSTVILIVVDCVEFDASFPRRAARSLFQALEGGKGKNSRLPKIVLVATKVDLLPSQISPARLDRWVRNRAKANGAPKLNGLFLVSSRKDLGVRNLLGFVKEAAGPRGNVWVVGAQNAGKSTLINCFARKEGAPIVRLTEAAVPGTTLGILRIGGVLPAKAKLYDTPGLLHANLMTTRLDREEQKMVEIRKELQPRTYRVKAGQTIHLGGLLRLDLVQSSVTTVYVTIWVSASVSLHLGKTENADEIWSSHVGVRLQPPIGPDRAAELGQWKSREIKVSGVSWDVSSVDVAVAGLGWLSFGLKGEATFVLWTYDGIQLTQREPLVLDRAPFIERPGFLLPKAISDALAKKSKLEREARTEKDETFA